MKHKIKNSLVIILLSLSCFGIEAGAQTRRYISLNEAIDLSVKNSKQLKLNRAKAEEAAISVKEALDRRLPDASASGSYLRLAQPHVKLPNGKDSAGNISGAGSSINVSQALYGIVNVSLPIYAGHRIQYGIESAKYLEKAVSLDAESDRGDVLLNTMNAYTNLYKANAATILVKENLEQSRQRVKDFSNLEKNGILARNDLLKAELQTSNIELALLDAESNRKVANVNMNVMLGLPEATELFTDSANGQTTDSLKTITDYEQLALQNRKDIEALSFRRKAAGTAVKSANAESYPSLALTGGYISAYVPNVVTITNAVNLGVGLQYNISSLWKNTGLQRAKSREKQVSINQEQLTDAVFLEVNKAYQDYIVSKKKIEVYASAIEQAAENYRISSNKYNNALLTTTDLLDADLAQLQAKLNYALAKADAQLAYNTLLHTAGLLNNQFK